MNMDVRPSIPDNFSSRIGDILITAPTITPETLCSQVFSMLVDDGSLPCLAVIGPDDAIVGMVSRAAYTAIMAKPLMGDLYAKRPVDAIMHPAPLILDCEDSIETAAERMVSTHPHALTEGFLISQQGKYAGVATAQDLLARSAADSRRAALENRRKSERIAALLDNSGQGFLSIGTDMVVEPDYSRACLSLLDTDPAGRDIALTMFPDDSQQASLLRRALDRIFQEPDDMRREMYLSLLPSRLERPGMAIDVEYIPMGRTRMMLVLSDVTARIALENSVGQERRKLDMIMSVLADSRDVFAAIADFRAFLARMDGITRPESSALLDGDDLYRQIHTFKGSFGQFGLDFLARELHQLEDRITAIRQRGQPGPDQRISLLDAVFEVKLPLALKRDLRVLADVFGDDFVAGEGAMAIPTPLARQLCALATRLSDRPDLLPPQDREIVRAVADLGRLSLRRSLENLAPMAARLATRLGKRLSPLVVDGPDCRLDPDQHGLFLRNLGHVIRNAVVHGIESPEDRADADKPENGTIRCTLAADADHIRLTIADDGQGIDPDRIRQKAAALLPAEGVSQWTDDALIQLVFQDGLSTRDQADQDSGRGVGLAAIRACVQRCGGTARVNSQPGQGTCFTFLIPKSPPSIDQAASPLR